MKVSCCYEVLRLRLASIDTDGEKCNIVVSSHIANFASEDIVCAVLVLL